DHPNVEQADVLDLSDGRPVALVVGAEDEWIVDAVPTESVTTDADGRIRVVLRVTAEPWLQRLLLRLGPTVEARDVDTGEDLRPLGATAARRVLRRYR
ncbi:MAG TPA: hypothetical protein PKA87_11775, partial [Microthrixaceae bacterium]|nr:hypothetical protein [Microthrixaceae bacterium]